MAQSDISISTGYGPAGPSTEASVDTFFKARLAPNVVVREGPFREVARNGKSKVCSPCRKVLSEDVPSGLCLCVRVYG